MSNNKKYVVSKEKRNEYVKNYRLKHKDDLKDKQKIWCRKWRMNNIERYREIQRHLTKKYMLSQTKKQLLKRVLYMNITREFRNILIS
jgi:hypothetical protein